MYIYIYIYIYIHNICVYTYPIYVYMCVRSAFDIPKAFDTGLWTPQRPSKGPFGLYPLKGPFEFNYIYYNCATKKSGGSRLSSGEI